MYKLICAHTHTHTQQLQTNLLLKVIHGESAELVGALISMEDAQANFQILGLSYASGLPHLLRTVPPSITYQAVADYYASVEKALERLS